MNGGAIITRSAFYRTCSYTTLHGAIMWFPSNFHVRDPDPVHASAAWVSVRREAGTPTSDGAINMAVARRGAGLSLFFLSLVHVQSVSGVCS